MMKVDEFYICILDLFNDAFSSSDSVLRNGMVIGKCYWQYLKNEKDITVIIIKELYLL